jgi:hypothetical protein
MARQNQQAGDGLDDREIAIFDRAEMFVCQALEGGRWRKQMYRTFSEAHAAAAMSPDPKARIVAQSADGSKVTIERNDWARWVAHQA